MQKALVFILLLGSVFAASAASYFPEYVEGKPIAATVVALKKADYRGKVVYQIDFTVSKENSTNKSSFIKRQYEEFVKLNRLLQEAVDSKDWSWILPDGKTVNVDTLNKMIQAIMKNDKARDTSIFDDFLGINWNAQGVNWFKSLDDFMHMILVARLPQFPPEPPIIEEEAEVIKPEVPFEKYVYLKAFKEGFTDIEGYTQFFRNYTKLTPKFLGEKDDLDVRPPNAKTALKIPYHYTKAYVHFLPDGYLNGQTVRVSYCGYSKFNFLKEKILREWITKLHGGKPLKRILDIGTGGCFSAIVYAELFPNAEVIGIDLAAPYIRFCNIWKEARGIKNVKFYQDNGESTSFEADSFDLIQYTYVLHEMPMENAEMLLKEILRLLKPGGVMSGFEVPYQEDPIERAMLIASQTWGYKWNSDGPKGPEPFTAEYQERTVLPRLIGKLGFIENKIIENSAFDSVYLSKKPTNADKAVGKHLETPVFKRYTSRQVLTGKI